MGRLYVCQIPGTFLCLPSLPKYRSLQRAFQLKRVGDPVIRGKPFLGKKWRQIKLTRQTLPPQVWQVKAQQVYLARDGTPTE